MDILPDNSISPVEIHKPSQLFKKEDSNLFLGSCFAENIYHLYEDNYVDCLFSPFGNIYNPLSLSNSLKLLCGSNRIEEKDIFIHKELWRHFDFDTRLCTTEKDTYLETINNKLVDAREYIKNCSYLFLTLGTSYVYRNKETGQVVNNCHKLPGNNFLRKNCTISEMKTALSSALKQVKNINPSIHFIVTLSPVRHLRDSAEENSLSKARLRCLIDELNSEEDLQYFPAYEIQLDQLRDYRWYSNDLTHPSEKAVSYIINRFIEATADSDFKIYLDDTAKLNAMLNHRILHETTESHTFRMKTQERFYQLMNKYPSMDTLKQKYELLISRNQ